MCWAAASQERKKKKTSSYFMGTEKEKMHFNSFGNLIPPPEKPTLKTE